MRSMLSRPAFGPRIALTYVTAGSLLDVWTAVWYYFQVRGNPEVSNNTWFWLTGLFLTGLTLIILGLLLGPLGQRARQAELPPPEAEHKEQAIQQTAAANPPMMAPGMAPGMPMGMPPAGYAPMAPIPPQPAPPVGYVPPVRTV